MWLLHRLEESLVAFALVVMLALNFGNVVGRYVFGNSWSFAGEITLILFVWLVFLGSAIVYKRSEHLGLSLAVDSAPRKIRIPLLLLSGLASAVVIVFVILSGYDMVANQVKFDQRTSVLSWPSWLAGASVPAGGVFILWRIIEDTVYQVRVAAIDEDVR